MLGQYKNRIKSDTVYSNLQWFIAVCSCLSRCWITYFLFLSSLFKFFINKKMKDTSGRNTNHPRAINTQSQINISPSFLTYNQSTSYDNEEMSVNILGSNSIAVNAVVPRIFNSNFTVAGQNPPDPKNSTLVIPIFAVPIFNPF